MFPGLGWLLIRPIWDRFGKNWPAGYWDDWLRDNSANMSCIIPEVSRSYTFGETGTSGGE